MIKTPFVGIIGVFPIKWEYQPQLTLLLSPIIIDHRSINIKGYIWVDVQDAAAATLQKRTSNRLTKKAPNCSGLFFRLPSKGGRRFLSHKLVGEYIFVQSVIVFPLSFLNQLPVENALARTSTVNGGLQYWNTSLSLENSPKAGLRANVKH